MIKDFASKETEKLFYRHIARRLPSEIQSIARRKLEILDAAENISDLIIPPSNHLEKLFGDRQGQYSIRINDRYWICFNWRDGDAYAIEIVDYH